MVMTYIFRATIELRSGELLCWLLEANHLEEAIQRIKHHAPKVLAKGWKVKGIEELGLLLLPVTE
jgi:hypothetical protein